MNDLDVMDRFRADVPAPEPAALLRARDGMFAPTAARKSRWVWRLAPAAGLAAAAAVTVVAVRAQQPVPSGPPVTAGPAPAAAPLDAAHLLRLAAAEARSEPVLPAHGNQFVYVQSRVSWAAVNLGTTGPGEYVPAVPKNRQVWLSVDGSRPGLVRERFAQGGKHPGIPLNNLPLDKEQAAYKRDLPTDAKAMREYLYQHGTGRNAPDARAFTEISDLLREKYVPPASLAAVFEAAATIPGTTVVRNQVDSAGRPGTAVSLTDRGIRHDLIFDPATYRLLGERDVAVGAEPFPRNAVIGYTAQLKIAIVDRAGQLP
jgi:hypothetical protein